MNDSRPVVLVLLGCFWPGNDASGPNQSFIALATALSHEFAFHVVARAGAPGAPRKPAPATVDLGYARAHYLDVGRWGAKGLHRLLSETPHDLLWLNSVFDRELTLPALALRRLRRLPRRPTLLSPRGEFGTGALALKSARKQIFLGLARRLGIWRGVTLHATSAAEAHDMRAGGVDPEAIVVAPNVRLMPQPVPFVAGGQALRVIFVGRIAPIKNLDLALRTLARVQSRVEFEIVGPEEDPAFVRRCRLLAQDLPANVTARWRGPASNRDILAALARSDLFFLPTGGENFGHAIFEALSSGVPVLISDRTPWRGLEAGRAGFDLPLDDPAAFVAAIERMAALATPARADWREGAKSVAELWVRSSDAVASNARLLRALTSTGAR